MRKLIHFKRGTILWALICLAQGLVAQQPGQQTQTVVRGTVKDAGGLPVPGVTVVELDADDRVVSGANTDMNGNYALRVSDPEQARIRVSFIGFTTETVPVQGKATLDFTLKSSAEQLGTVEVVAEKRVSSGMLEIPERELTTAVSTLEAKELEEMQAVSIDQALQGRMAGVDIVANSGDPGAGMSIRIRGTSSINSSSEPMIVLDGMPYDTDVASGFDFSNADEQGYAQLLNIAPADIQTITVLRDAAATAVWGSRASNGVIVITTKRGTVSKPRIDYTFRGSATRQPEPIPMLSGDQYSQLVPEAYMNRTGTSLNTLTVKEFQYDPSDPYWYHNYSNNSDWIGAITRNGLVHDHNLSLSGGGEKGRYRASLAYTGQRGTTTGTDLGRITARVNLDYRVSDRIQFRTDLAYTYMDNNRLYRINGTRSNDDALRSVAYRKMPNMSIHEKDIYGNETPNWFSPAQNIQGNWSRTYNPLALSEAGIDHVKGNRVIPRFNVQYHILPEVLLFTGDVQFDINNSKTNKFLPQVATGRPWTETSVNRAEDIDEDLFTVQSMSKLIYTPKLDPDRHSLIAMLAFQTYDNRGDAYLATTSNTASSALQDPSVPSRTQNDDLNLQSGSYQSRSLGLLLNAQYNYLDRYLLNAGIRMDGSSRFGATHRRGYFPTVSARWRISAEPFMESLHWMDDLSLRLSYGQSGNAPRRDYLHYNRYQNFDWNYLGRPAVYPSTMELSSLRWETVTQENLGFNLILFDDRVNIDVDFYRKRTDDLFFEGLRLPSTSGFSSVDANVGVMDNQGWELSVFTTPVRKGDFRLDFNFNIARNENVIRSISEYYPRETGRLTNNGEYLVTIQENNPIGSFYGYRFKGVYPDEESTIARDAGGNAILDPSGQPVYMRFSYPVVDYQFQPGDARYEDINHDGNIDYKDVVYLGDANPKLVGGFGPTLTWKNWRATAYFNFRYGADVINSTRMNTENMYTYDNQSTAVLKRWRAEGDQTDMPRALLGTGYNWLASDRYVEDGSFLRFRTVTLRYEFPAEMLRRFRASKLSLYVTAENIFTLTRYTGQDPEVSLRGPRNNPFSFGYDYSMTPPVGIYTLGLVVGF